MKVFRKIAEAMKSFIIKIPLRWRIGFAVIIVGFIVVPVIISTVSNSTTERWENKENVYLYEEVEFADEIYIKVIGINVIEAEGIYALNLKVNIEQWNTDMNINQQKMRPNMFELRLVDKYALSPMSVFIQSLATATISSMLSGTVIGEINVLEETLGFAANYVTGLIENATSGKDRTIASNEDAFEPYYPYLQNGVSNTVELSFALNDDFLNSNKTMVLSIDDGLKRVQKNIFLVLRANTNPYTVQFDLNNGSSEFLNNSINVDPGQIINLPEEEPVKEGYRFLCWTLKNGKISTKIRDLYFYTYDENKTFIIYAYYQPTIPIDEFVNIGKNISFKNDTYLIKVTNLSFSNTTTIKNLNKEDIVINSTSKTKFLILNVCIEKTSIKNNHTLDNKDDFFIKNRHATKNVTKYFGYIKFNKMKPVDDFSWIGIKLNEIGIYQIILTFEVPEFFDNINNLYFLEIDFFYGKNADSILLR